MKAQHVPPLHELIQQYETNCKYDQSMFQLSAGVIALLVLVYFFVQGVPAQHFDNFYYKSIS